MPLFVVHEHSGHGPTHYDLMLEHGSALATWQIVAAFEEIGKAGAIPAIKLPDHRRHYLSYQGPVSWGRGQITLADKGDYSLLETAEDCWLIELDGQVLRGRFELRRLQGRQWTIQRT